MALHDDIPGVMLVLVPRPSMPDHLPLHFGAPFSLSIPPHKPFKCEGNLAKALHCEFPDMFFLANDDGTYRPFPSDKTAPPAPAGSSRAARAAAAAAENARLAQEGIHVQPIAPSPSEPSPTPTPQPKGRKA